MLKLFIDKQFLSPKLSYSPLLYPFYGPIFKTTLPYISSAFRSTGFDSHYYKLVSHHQEADFIFFPHNYWLAKTYLPLLLNNFLHTYKKFSLPILLDAYGDSSKDIPFPQSVILRTSKCRHDLKDNEIIIPAYVEDLLQTYYQGKLIFRRKQTIPSIGFTGWGDISFLSRPITWLSIRLKLFFYYLGISPSISDSGLVLRRCALNSLKKSSFIKTNFLIRNSYSGHTKTISLPAELARTQYIENIHNSDYILCVRGDGNYSYRFFEILSLGRIPVVVDTDIALPLVDKIEYQKFCLFISLQDLPKIDMKIAKFHAQLRTGQFYQMQKLARQTFAKFLRLDSFTKYLVADLKRYESKNN